MKILTRLLEINWLIGVEHGYANGYVGVPTDHPWFGKHYDEVNESVEIHGGLTWSADHVGKEKIEGYWWLGFDTAHFMDTMETCNERFCQSELQYLREQAEKAASETEPLYCKWSVNKSES